MAGKIIHGDSSRAYHAPEYYAWQSMRKRCSNPNFRDYHRYGGRGIKVCERWENSYEDFLADVGRRPSSRHSLDRYPNNDGNYEPGNVRWATAEEQGTNRSTTTLLEFDGHQYSMAQLARKFNIPKNVLWMRLSLGWELTEALTKPRRKYGAR